MKERGSSYSGRRGTWPPEMELKTKIDELIFPIILIKMKRNIFP